MDAPTERGGRRRSLPRRLWESTFPAGCAGCGVAVPAERPPLCGLCESRLPAVPPPRCARCGATAVGGFASPGRCPECEAWPACLPRAAAAFRHAGVARRLVYGLKYRGWTDLAPWMGAALAPAARRLASGVRPTLVPVPLAAARLRQRGFNQAGLLAAALGTAAGWTVREPLLRREAGPSQVRLGRARRLRNVSGRFEVRERSGGSSGTEGTPGWQDGAPCLLVDDVLTTGATAAACAATLRDAGLACAGIVTFTRARRRFEEL